MRDSTPSRGARVPLEVIGLARRRRDRICADYAAAVPAGELLIRPLRPRPDFTPMPRHDRLRELARRWPALPPLSRLGGLAVLQDTCLRIAELRAGPVQMRFTSWDGDDELAVTVRLRLIRVAPPQFHDSDTLVAYVGLHALARRFERGADRSDEGVLRDLAALAPTWRGAAAKGGDFAIPDGGGLWIGSVTRVLRPAGADVP